MGFTSGTVCRTVSNVTRFYRLEIDHSSRHQHTMESIPMYPNLKNENRKISGAAHSTTKRQQAFQTSGIPRLGELLLCKPSQSASRLNSVTDTNDPVNSGLIRSARREDNPSRLASLAGPFQQFLHHVLNVNFIFIFFFFFLYEVLFSHFTYFFALLLFTLC